MEGFMTNTHRYTQMFDDLAFKMLPKRNINRSDDEELRFRFENVLKSQRRENLIGSNGIFE